ncbi:MAG TPA: hypothetical protein VM262_14345 [Acidimicrobiales bacterium]|nr:hypothetical protein [Acidimicrobiales bacterium]
MPDPIFDDDHAGDLLKMRTAHLGELAQAVSHDPDMRPLVRTVSQALDQAAASADSATARRKALAEDDLTPREGRERLSREAMDKGRSTVTRSLEQADAGLAAMEARLRARSLPKAPSDRAEDHARQELPLLLANTSDPLSVLIKIATGDDEALAAVAVGRLGRSLLAKADPDADHSAVIDAALGAAARSSSPDRKKAAAALAAVKVAGAKARGIVANGTAMRFDD